MSQAKQIQAAPVGEYIYVNLPNGAQIQIKTETEGVTVDIWTVSGTDCVASCYAFNSDLEDGEKYE